MKGILAVTDEFHSRRDSNLKSVFISWHHPGYNSVSLCLNILSTWYSSVDIIRWIFNDRANPSSIDTLRPRQNGYHFTNSIFKCIFLNENVWIPIKISLRFVPKCPINNISSLLQIMAWHQPGDKPLSEPMMASLPMHISVTPSQWVKIILFSPWVNVEGAIFSHLNNTNQ